MKQESRPSATLVDRAIWRLEMALGSALMLEVLADVCGASPHHLVRAFQTATGIAPMAYLRMRRLSVAAETLATGRVAVMDAALDAGYGSHEAFTRAFTRQFGMSPSAVRETGRLPPKRMRKALQMTHTARNALQQPERRNRASFDLVGLSIRLDHGDIADIPSLWERFNVREDELQGAKGKTAYGVCYGATETGFAYLAGMEANNGPADIKKLHIEAAHYAVFAHVGHIAGLPSTVKSIWNGGLEDAGVRASNAPDFEVYGPTFDVRTGHGRIEI